MRATDLDKEFWGKVKRFRAAPYDWRSETEKHASEVGSPVPYDDIGPFAYGKQTALLGISLEGGLNMLSRSSIENKAPELFTAGYKSVDPKDVGSKLLTK